MKTIKSEKAAELIEVSFAGTKNDVRLSEEHIAIQAVIAAEEDAEERAVKVFEQALQKLSESPKLTLSDMQQWVKDFRQLIGG